MSADHVDEYLAKVDEPKRSTLEHLRRFIAAVIPEAEQGLSYGVPVFKIAGKPVAGFWLRRTGSATFRTAARPRHHVG